MLSNYKKDTYFDHALHLWFHWSNLQGLFNSDALIPDTCSPLQSLQTRRVRTELAEKFMVSVIHVYIPLQMMSVAVFVPWEVRESK